jgi:hypothetical protein
MFTYVSAGNGSACAIRSDGEMKCWGETFYPQSAIPAGPFARVDVYIGACAIRPTGEIACWGGEPAPTGSGTFLDVGSGEGAACALRMDGTMHCWGGASDDTSGRKFDSMSEGAYFVCGLEIGAHDAVCWGPPDMMAMTPGPFRQVGAGRFYACGLLMDGSAQCWPLGITGQPMGPSPPGPFQELSVGEFTVCGLRADGSVACWGKNIRGEGDPPPDARFKHVSVGSSHSCGILLDGTLTCWGEAFDPCAPG